MRLNGRLTYSAGLFATLLLGWLTVTAQTSVPASNLGTISGRVVNESGRPLANVHIVVKVPGSTVSNEDHSTNTDRDGKFELSGLKPMNYQISAVLQGYVPVLRNDLEDAQARLYRVGDSVSLVMTKGGVVTGTVKNQVGEPVVGVRVHAMMVRATGRLPFFENIMSPTDRTDDRGVYRIFGLLEGNYIVWAGASGPMYSDPDPFANDVRSYAPSSTRDAAHEIAVRAGAEASGVDIVYRGGSGYAVSGKVSGPANSQYLTFAVFLSSSGSDMRASQGPNERGFLVNGVDDGDYEIFAVSADRPEDDWLVSASKQIKVRGADVEGIELIVHPLSSITGRMILEESTVTGCNDKRRPIFTETLVSAQSDSADTLPRSLDVLRVPGGADERGNIKLKNLSPGRYYFTTQHFADDWYLKSIMIVLPERAAKPVDAARSWTTLKSGDRLQGLTITLAPGAASLRAQVGLRKGETLEEKMFVYLVPAESEAADDPLRFYGATVTADGKVALNSLAPGRYLILAQRATDDTSLTMLRSPEGTGNRARLHRQAEALKAEIELKPCQRVTDFKVPVRTN